MAMKNISVRSTCDIFCVTTWSNFTPENTKWRNNRTAANWICSV